MCVCVQVFVELEELKADSEGMEWEETARSVCPFVPP